jgi:glycosyltransferase involved in cell wall biosynthesis
VSQGRPRVSIGVPVFNGERFLAETLDSLLNQTFSDLEVVISDNASTDQTEEICRAYAAHDARIRYYRNDVNRRAAWNHNRVF